LREVNYGFWDGRADEELIAEYPLLWEERNRSKWEWNGYDGESYFDAHERALKWLEKPLNNHLIVCHRTFGKILRGAFAGLTPEEILATDFLHGQIFELKGK